MVVLQTWPEHGMMFATQILLEEPHATFIHCYGHALNLAAGI